MKDQILKIAKVKSEKEFYKKYPSEEAFMKAHGKEFKKAAMGKKMVNDQLHDLTSWDNPAKAQVGIGLPKMPKQNFNKYLQGTNQPGLNPDGSVKQVGDAFNNASMAQYSAQQTAADMSAQYATPSADQLLGKNEINSGATAGKDIFNEKAAGNAALGALPKVISGIEAIGAQRKAQKKAQQSAELSGLALTAQNTAQKPKNQYVTPYDTTIQPGQLGNPYGSKTNYLQAQYGTMIGGNPTEIQNTYAPTGDIYQDLGFEPMEETYKQYRHGGELPKAEFGEYFQDSGEAQIGSAVGGAVAQGFGLPPVLGELVGKGLGNVFGGAKNARKLQAQKDKTAMNQSMMGFMQARSQGPLSANVKNGGWISHDWQPQVFAKFGDYDAKDLLKPPHDADMLRSGGHLAQVGYTAPSAEALFTGRPELQPLTMNTGGRLPSTNMMFDTDRYPRAENGVQMAMGGDLEVGDGGHLETLSYNPNLPGGEIGMFRGASHDNGGIKTKYGENEVEVEGNEPVVKLQDGGSTENLVVFGNIKINKEIADLMGDPKAKGKKFKTYIADVAKNDAKQVKRINKALELIETSDENTAFDHLKLNTGKAILEGAKAWQKINADKIKEAGLVQDAIHQTANELGVKSDKLAEGKLEKEYDPSMMAQQGNTYKYNVSKKYNTGKEIVDAIMQDALKGVPKIQNVENEFIQTPFERGRGDAPELQEVVVGGNRKQPVSVAVPSTAPVAAAEDKKGFDWKGLGMAALSQVAPWLRPSNANEPLNPDQLMGEYYALAMNQLDPVQAQKYQPMLDTPYDISFNDQLNAIDAQGRAATRALGNNPAAQAIVTSQIIEAKNKLFGESNRINQANKMAVYDKNRATLNDAQLKNLAILDQQYVRQAQAKSNTKAQTQAALNSIAAKTAQQRAANRKLGVLENMYNFRFSPSGRAYSVNLPQQFDLSGMNAKKSGLSSAGLPANKRFTIDSVTGEPVGIRTLTKDEMAGNTPSLSEISDYLDKNGGKTPKTKARNSSIVKALKNL